MKFLQVALLFTFLMLVANVAGAVIELLGSEDEPYITQDILSQARRDGDERDRTMRGRMRWG